MIDVEAKEVVDDVPEPAFNIVPLNPTTQTPNITVTNDNHWKRKRCLLRKITLKTPTQSTRAPLVILRVKRKS